MLFKYFLQSLYYDLQVAGLQPTVFVFVKEDALSLCEHLYVMSFWQC